MRFAEMAKLTSFIREKTIPMLIADQQPLIDFQQETEKNEIMIYVSDDQTG